MSLLNGLKKSLFHLLEQLVTVHSGKDFKKAKESIVSKHEICLRRINQALKNL